jgi:hypothetical protein
LGEKKMNIFVGSKSYDVTETIIKKLFEVYEEVTSAKIITDRDIVNLKVLDL